MRSFFVCYLIRVHCSGLSGKKNNNSIVVCAWRNNLFPFSAYAEHGYQVNTGITYFCRVFFYLFFFVCLEICIWNPVFRDHSPASIYYLYLFSKYLKQTVSEQKQFSSIIKKKVLLFFVFTIFDHLADRTKEKGRSWRKKSGIMQFLFWFSGYLTNWWRE